MGGLGNYMARHYGVSVTGVTVSKAQVQYAREHSQGLDTRWLLQDYRSLTGKYDRIVSVGMFEHVGHKNYAVYMDTVRKLLAENGLFLLHTIGANEPHHSVDPWIEKYIFRNGILPSISLLGNVRKGALLWKTGTILVQTMTKLLCAGLIILSRDKEKGSLSAVKCRAVCFCIIC